MSSREAPSPESQRVFAPGILDGQVAIVTGGGSGIGLVTATELVRAGARVAICGRTLEKLEAARAEIGTAMASRRGTRDEGVGSAESEPRDRVHVATCDIREPDQVTAFVAGVVARWGAVDILINNAGGQFPSPAQFISPNGFAAVVKNNLIGTFHVTREVGLQSMIPRKRGRIVNVIANIYRGFPGMVHTGAARAGVENMTMSLAVEWSQFGILVNAVAPGVIASSGTKRYPPEILALAIKNTPLRRAGTVDEVAAAIVFLVSPAAQYISGATLRIDGAQSLWGDTWQLPE
jgi:citronellol/citronellal dehydrogenase